MAWMLYVSIKNTVVTYPIQFNKVLWIGAIKATAGNANVGRSDVTNNTVRVFVRDSAGTYYTGNADILIIGTT